MWRSPYLHVDLMQRRAGADGGPAAVHLERAHRAHQHGAVRPRAARTTLYVEELLHACEQLSVISTSSELFVRCKENNNVM